MVNKRKRAARATVLWSLGGFVALQLGLIFAVERWFPEFRDPYYGYRVNLLSRRTVRAAPQPLTVLMLGTSRTQWGFRANILEKPLGEAAGRPVIAFNFGQAGAGPVTELLNLKRLLTDGIRPDLLFIEVLPPILCGQLENFREMDELRHPTHRLRLGDLPLVKQYGGKQRENVALEWWESSLVPWHSHRFAILSCLAPRLLANQSRIEGVQNLDESGCIDLHTVQPTPEKRQKALDGARREYSHYLTGFRLGGPNCEALRELLALCRERDIRTALVLMPEGPTFRTWYPPGVWNEIQTYLNELSGTYATPIINCREWIPETEFMDSHHLLAAGAAEFTERLGREAILPLLLGGKPTDDYRPQAPGPLAGKPRDLR